MTLEEQITELRLQLADLESRLAALEGPSPVIPKWEDIDHRHTEDEFA